MITKLFNWYASEVLFTTVWYESNVLHETCLYEQLSTLPNMLYNQSNLWCGIVQVKPSISLCIVSRLEKIHILNPFICGSFSALLWPFELVHFFYVFSVTRPRIKLHLEEINIWYELYITACRFLLLPAVVCNIPLFQCKVSNLQSKFSEKQKICMY